MKSKKTKKFLCLLMVLTLLSGLLTGCRTKPENSNTTATTEESSTTSEEPSGTIDYGVIHPTLPTHDYLSASPDDHYYTSNLQWPTSTIGLSDAWEITTGSSNIRVGIIDSGIDVSHSDLQNRVNTELSESFVPGHSALEDSIGHGTHIAGIIGAR